MISVIEDPDKQANIIKQQISILEIECFRIIGLRKWATMYWLCDALKSIRQC